VRSFGNVNARVLDTRTLQPESSKVVARGRTSVQIGDSSLDLSALVQLSHDSQTRAIAAMLKYLIGEHKGQQHEKLKLVDILRKLQTRLDECGLDVLSTEGRIDGFLARPRVAEMGMAINRLVSAIWFTRYLWRLLIIQKSARLHCSTWCDDLGGAQHARIAMEWGV